MNQPALVYSPHPLSASAGRQQFATPFLQGESIAAYIERCEIRLGSQAWKLHLGQFEIPREKWGEVYPQSGDLITLRALVRGGDGGSKDVMRTIAMIAVLIYAPQMSTSLGWGTAGTVILSTAGMVLVNNVFPPQLPGVSADQYDTDNGSPTYSVNGGQNRARIYQPLPLVLGHHRVFPDLGAKAFTEFKGEDQYLYQVFNFGLGDIDIDLATLKIGDTPLTDYDGMTDDLGNLNTEVIQVSGRDGKLDLFPGNVDTIAGGELTAAAGWVTRTSSIDTTRLAIELSGTQFHMGNRGEGPLTSMFEVDYQRVGDVSWTQYAAATTYTHYWSRGYYHNSGFRTRWVQLGYDAGDVNDHVDGELTGEVITYTEDLGGEGIFVYTFDVSWRWRPYSEVINVYKNDARPPQTRVPEETTITNGSRDPVRKTFYIERLPRDQYNVRVRRFTPDPTSSRDVSEITWSQLRSYQPDDTDYSGQTRVALKIKASGQLNGTISALSAEVYSQAPVWQNPDWLTEDTSNPAWLFAYVARGKADTNGHPIFGVNIQIERIDWPQLIAWAAWCDAHGLTCDVVFDRSMTVAEMLGIVARCGRASPTWKSGKLGVVFDEEDQPAKQVFGMANIRKGSFKVEYISENLADEIIVKFTNPDLGWKPDEVRVTVPGVSNPTRPTTINLMGCTSKTMAGKEANLLAARQFYHRRRISWEADMEGLTVDRGDVVQLSHDLTQWGFSGRLVSGTTTVLKLPRTVPFTPSQQHYVGLRHPDGSYTEHQVQYQVGESDTLTLTDPIATAPDDSKPIDWLWVFDPKATPGKKVKITSIEPQGLHQVRINATDEEPAYYAAEGGAYTYVPPTTYTHIGTPTLTELTATPAIQEQTNLVRVRIGWTLNNAERARLLIGLNGGAITDYGEIVGSNYSIDLPEGTEMIIIARPVALAELTDYNITPTTLNYTVVAGAAPLPVPDVTGMELVGENGEGGGNSTSYTGRDIKTRWTDMTTQSYELGEEPFGAGSERRDPSFTGYLVQVFSGDSTDEADLRHSEVVHESRYTYPYELNVEDGGGTPSRQVTIEVYYTNRYGRMSATPARMVVTNPAPALPSALQVDAGYRIVSIDFDEPTDLDYQGVTVWMHTASGFTPGTTNQVFKGRAKPIMIERLANGSPLTTGSTYYVVIQTYDAFGDEGTQSVEMAVTTVAVGDENISSMTIDKLLTGTLTAEELKLGVAGIIRSLLKTAIDDGNPGILLGHIGGVDQFYVGDGVEKFLAFDGDDVVMGAKTDLRGADAIGNRSGYFHTFFETIDGVQITTATASDSVSHLNGSNIVVYSKTESGVAGQTKADQRRNAALVAGVDVGNNTKTHLKAKLRIALYHYGSIHNEYADIGIF